MSAPQMQYVRLGQSGLKISKIILGCMTYGHPEWSGNWVLAEEEASKHIKAAYDYGINAFDTANVYSNGISEEILGRSIKKHRLPARRNRRTDLDSSGYVNQYELSRKHIFDSVKHSLRRLDLEYIDLLQCHRFDPNTPISETMQTLHDVVKAGYVRYIGMSSCYAYQYYAITNGLTPFISMQNQYSLVYREEEREMMPLLDMFGVGSIPWSPLARGALSRPLAKQTDTNRGSSDVLPSTFYVSSDANKEVVRRAEQVAAKRGISMAQVSVAWVLSKKTVSAPIVGTSSLENLRDIVGVIDVKLTEEEIKLLEEPYRPMAIFGH
ncbi:NADP-dependent oxidoreductase domain-containing protein [Mycena rebaudengoi]|nr:NADP-dependent oxidoreductase domain-containing protein [Mycena rebaudengoi]